MQGVECYKHVNHDVDWRSLVLAHGPLIKKIAFHIKCRLPPHIELDDLIQAGLIGLFDAHKKYDLSKGASFETYASIKIRAAIIDDLRVNSGLGRQLGENMKKVAEARSRLENCPEPDSVSSKRVADELGIDVDRYSDMMTEIHTWKSMHPGEESNLDDIPHDDRQNPLAQVEQENIRSVVKAVIGTLPKREQQILALYYNEQLNFREIADILALTEARVSQIHTLALTKVRKKYQFDYGQYDFGMV